jgi:hypothetical protein
MSNITARKGLAFGALVALGSTLLAGAPAHAAAGVTLAPVAGTSLNLPAGYGYELRATASSEIPSDRFAEFKFKVTSVDAAAATVETFDQYGNLWDTDSVDGTAGDSIVLDGFGHSNGYGVNNGTVYINSNTNDATSHFVVTAFLDANNNDVVDGGELAGTQTINFLKAADLTATTTVTTPIYAGDTTVAAKTVLTNINVEQFAGSQNEELAYVSFKSNTDDLGTDDASLSSGTWSASVSTPARAAKQIISAQAWVYVDGALAKVGSANTATVIAHGVNHIDTDVAATVNSHADGDIATNSNFAVTLTANDVVDGNDVAVAGAKLAVTIDADLLNALSADNGVSITVNGVKYTSYASLPGQGSTAALSLTTDSKGQVVLNVSSTGLSNNDGIGFYAVTEGSVSNGWYWTTQQDRSFTASFTGNINGAYGAVAGGTTNGSVVVHDQFGGLLPDGYDARVSYQNGSRSDTNASGDSNSYSAVVGGKANFKIVDNGKGTGWSGYKISFDKRDATNGGYGDPVVTADTIWAYVYYVAAADLVPAEIVDDGYATKDDKGVYQFDSNQWGSSNYPVDVETADFGNYDSTAVLGTEPSVSWNYNAGNYTYFGGYVNSATTTDHVGVAVPGQTVTISGAGLQFETESNWDAYRYVYATDSLTTTTDDDGYFYVNVHSHKSGLNSFTITVGGVTQKVEFYVAAPASNSGANVVLSAPVYSLPAKFIEASATVTDKFGNAVDDAPLTLSVKGLGKNDSNTWTDADGKVYLNLSTGLNDLGSLAWTAELNNDYNWNAVGANDITKTATTVVALGALVAADAKVAVSAAATSQSGRAVDVTVTVTTAAGVAIPGAIVALSSTGAGYLGATTATTDANGKVAVKLVAGASETGDATVTATAGSVSASAKTTFGVTDANINLAGKRVTVDWSFAAGKRVVIYRNGVQIRNFVAASDASDSFSFNLKKGTRKIAVKVGGVTIDSQTYVIK